MTRSLAGFALLTTLAVAVAAASAPAARRQTPAQPPVAAPAQAAPTPPPAVPSSRKFTSDAGVMFCLIKPDKTADFEAVMARIKDGLSRSQDAKRKQQALGWRVYKGLESGPGGAVVYMWLIDPPVKDVEYVVTDILVEAFPNEAQDLWAKFTNSFLQPMTMLNLQQVLNMNPTAAIK